MSVIAIKLEMAELSLKANRIEEAEKIIMDVILDPTTDSDSQYSAFIALGSIKMIKVLKNAAIFSEVEYCYKKAYAIKDNELTIDAYLFTLSYFLKTATEVIEISKKNIKNLEIKAGIDILVTIGSAYVLNQRGNSLLTNVVGLIGLDYGVNGVIGDINSIEGFKNLITYLNSNINEVVEKYNNPSLPLNEKQIEYFEDELIKNKIKEISSEKINQLDLSEKIGLLFNYFEDAIKADIKFSFYQKSRVLIALEGKETMSMTLNGLRNSSKTLRKYFDENCESIYWSVTKVDGDNCNIIFTEKSIKILIIKNTLSFNTEPKEIITIDYNEFFNYNISVSPKGQQNIIIQLSNDIEIDIISFGFPFKTSTKNKQIEMVNKIANLFKKQ